MRSTHSHRIEWPHSKEPQKPCDIMASHESLLISAMRLDRNRINRYCRTVDPSFLERLNRRKPKTMEQLADIWYEGVWGSRNQHYNDSRYRMLNYHACFTHKTIEFRCFQFANAGNGRKGGFTQENLRVTYSFASHSARWRKR